MSRSPLAIATVASFVLGVGLLFPFESTVPVLAGIFFLFAFVVFGLFLILDPSYLGQEGEGEEES
jgi:hypothetical protein